MSSPLTDNEVDLPSAEESGPESELSGSDGEEDNGSAVLCTEDSSEEDVQETVVRKKPRFFTPVSTGGKKRSGHLNSMSKTDPPRITCSKPHGSSQSKSLPRERCTPTTKPGPSTSRKVLNMSTPGDSSSGSNMTSVLGDISNMLGKVLERLDITESKIESMERTLRLQSSSSGMSGSEHRRKVSTVVRTETRKTYKALLDIDDFAGFDLPPDTTYQDEANRFTRDTLLKEVRLNNPYFSTADIRAAVYTYYTSLCQDESLKWKGVYSQRKIQRRRRERVVRVHPYMGMNALAKFKKIKIRRTEGESEFNKMSYNDSDREKWKKVLVTQLMSSDESGNEEDQAVFIVKELPWRSDKVTAFFEKLDRVCQALKTEQASRQTKKRLRKGVMSSRPAPSGLPTWAVQE